MLGRAIVMSRKNRMSELDRWMIPLDKGYSNANAKAQWRTLSPEEKAHAKRQAKRAHAFVWAQHKSGANQLADQTLRAFILEYNSRIARHGLIEYDLPASFEFMEAFAEYVPHLLSFSILPERDYMIDSSDFLEYISGDESPADAMSAAYELAESEIYNVTSVMDPHNTLIATDTDTIGFGAASIVRRGDEVVVMLICGSKSQPEALTKEEWMNVDSTKPWAQQIAEESARAGTPNKWFMLNGDLFKQIALVRYDLNRRTVVDRAIGWESGAHWQWISDQHIVARDVPIEKLRAMVVKLEKHRATFRLAESTLLVPS